MPFRARALALSFGFALTILLGALPGTSPEPAAAAGEKVAIIVGPTGITDSHYQPWAEDLADMARSAGATVDLRYCATPAEAKAAANGANIIVYFGHGNGFPNPYSSTENPLSVNGWGLRNPASTWDGKSCEDNVLRYYGEDYLTGKASGYGWTAGPITPAANFVMVYSNACYAPGAGESRPAPTEATALSRVGHYSDPIMQLGGTYFATDLGSEELVAHILSNPNASFGSIFERGNGFDANALRRFPHPSASGAEAWLHRTDSQWLGDDYWFAFAGDPTRTPNGGTTGYTGPAPASPFSDISGSKFYDDILWLESSGITSGCGGGRFCPDGIVTRAQMASFLARALVLPATSTNYFADDDGNKHEDNINRLAAAGITSGCAEGRFCPDGAVARDQMASFLERALTLPGSSVNWFTDDAGNKHESAINAIAQADVTRGCGSGRYCPAGAVTRGQMAAFLHRAFGD